MVVLGLKEKLQRRQEQVAEAENRAAQDFNKSLKDASDALDSHGDGDAASSAHIKVEKKKRNVDREMASIFPANQTFQASDKDIQLTVPGADKVIEVSPNSVPPLCRAGVLLSCPKNPNHCKHRHYYCSAAE
jgi:hypothetical protein